MTDSKSSRDDRALDPRLARAIDALPPELEPPPEAFAAIRARIEAQRVVPMAGGPPNVTPSRFPWRASHIAAAAVLLVATSVAGTWWVLRERPADAVAVGAATASPAPERAAAQTATMGNTAMIAVFSDYESAARDLERVLNARRDRLSPATVRAVTESLTAIDQAIGEARAALRRDPASRDLFDLLDSVYRQKLDLLRRVNALPLHSS